MINIENMESMYPDVTVITLTNGFVLSINDESLYVWRSIEDYNSATKTAEPEPLLMVYFDSLK
jgi:hypothetical protein